MFSGLSKLADKSFVLGFFLPALVGVVAFIAMNRDIEPLAIVFRDSMQEKTFANLTVVLLVVWTLSVLLMAGSHWMYRVLEGYVWPLSHPEPRKWQIERRKRQRTAVREAYAAVDAVESALGCSPAVPSETEREQRRLLSQKKLAYLRLKRALALEYPEQPELVLPTRFGNVLRAFEMYAGSVYGVESIHAWPRLLAVVPKDYQAILADARAPVDFFVSLVFMSFALGVVALARGGFSLLSGPGGAATWIFWSIAAVAFVSVRLCYLGALSSAIAWGEVVKSAFDLYLPALANAMGYELPQTAEDRRRFWEAAANQFQFHEPMQPDLWPTTAHPPPSTERSSTNHTGDGGEKEATDDAEAGESDEPNDNENREETGKISAGAAKDDAIGNTTVRG
jgi:hypothetical protein